MRWPNFLPQLPLRSDYLNAIKNYFDELILQRFKRTILSDTFGIVPGYPSLNNEFVINAPDTQHLIIKRGMAIDGNNRIILLDQDTTIDFNFTDSDFPRDSYKDCYIYVYYNEENDTSVVDYDTNGNPLYPYVKVESLFHFKLNTPEVQGTFILVAHVKLYKDNQGNIFIDSFDNASNLRKYSIINLYALFNNQLVSFQDHINQHGHGIVSPTNPHGLSLEDLGVDIVINHVVNKNGLILLNVNTNNSGFYFTFHSDTIKENNYIDVFLLSSNEIAFLNRTIYSRDDLDVSQIDFNNDYTRMWITSNMNDGTYYIKGQRNSDNNKLKLVMDSNSFTDTDLPICTFRLTNGRIDPFSIKDNRNIGFVDANTIDPILNVGYVWGLNTSKGNRNQKLFFVKIESDIDTTQTSYNFSGNLTFKTLHSLISNNLTYRLYSDYTKTTLISQGNWSNKSSTISWNNVPNGNYLILEGLIKVPADIFEFQLNASGKIKFQIDNETYIDSLDNTISLNTIFKIYLTSGKYYPIKIEFIADGGNSFSLQWRVSDSDYFNDIPLTNNCKAPNIISIPYSFVNITLWEIIGLLNAYLNPYNVFVRVTNNKLCFYTYNDLEIIEDTGNPNKLFSSNKWTSYTEYELLKRVEYNGDGIVGKEPVGNFNLENIYWLECEYDSSNVLTSIKGHLKDKDIVITPQYQIGDYISSINESIV
jgi:hypothetical protein